MSSADFKDQVIFITGASSGIGAALAREFARRGANVALAARRVDRLKQVEADCEKLGAKAFSVPCDVTVDGDLERAAARIREKFGKINVVVANAGFGVSGLLQDLSLEDFRRQFETNIFGLLRTLHATMDDVKKNRGNIVLLGSVASYVALPGMAPYSMSKFAVRALAEAITDEFGPLGVGVTLISPGFVESEINQVDNQGVLHPDADSATGMVARLRMPTQKAARQIVDAVKRRDRERIITGHGKVFVFIQRHFPWFSNLLKKMGAAHQPKGRVKHEA